MKNICKMMSASKKSLCVKYHSHAKLLIKIRLDLVLFGPFGVHVVYMPRS